MLAKEGLDLWVSLLTDSFANVQIQMVRIYELRKNCCACVSRLVFIDKCIKVCFSLACLSDV